MNFLLYRILKNGDELFLLCFKEEYADPVDESVVPRPEIFKVDRNVIVVEGYPQLADHHVPDVAAVIVGSV